MPPAPRKTHLKNADEAISMVFDATQFILASIEAYDLIKDSKKELIPDNVKIVFDNLPAVVGLLRDIERKWSAKVKLADAVWMAAADDILKCHYACKDLDKVLDDLYVRIRLQGGVASFESEKLWMWQGETAKEFLRTIHASMKRLVPLGIVTNFLLLDDIEIALAEPKSGADAISSAEAAEASLSMDRATLMLSGGEDTPIVIQEGE
jgi:hypothetical protein